MRYESKGDNAWQKIGHCWYAKVERAPAALAGTVHYIWPGSQLLRAYSSVNSLAVRTYLHISSLTDLSRQHPSGA